VSQFEIWKTFVMGEERKHSEAIGCLSHLSCHSYLGWYCLGRDLFAILRYLWLFCTMVHFWRTFDLLLRFQRWRQWMLREICLINCMLSSFHDIPLTFQQFWTECRQVCPISSAPWANHCARRFFLEISLAYSCNVISPTIDQTSISR
jgi:hypothetical protein